MASRTRSETGRMGHANHAYTQTTQGAGLPHVMLHGLLRSFGTLVEWVECPVGVVAQIQGHKPSAIAERHYRRRPIDLLRLWHERIEGWILEEAGLSVASAPNGAAVPKERAANRACQLGSGDGAHPHHYMRTRVPPGIVERAGLHDIRPGTLRGFGGRNRHPPSGCSTAPFCEELPKH